MSNWKLTFDVQKRELESLQVGSPEEQDAITKAGRLNREGLEFAEQHRELEAKIRLAFVDQLIEAITNKKYRDFKLVVDYLVHSSDEH